MQLPETCKPHRWLNSSKLNELSMWASKIESSPRFLVLDQLFTHEPLTQVAQYLQNSKLWQQQRHSYAQLNVSDEQWERADAGQQFVQRDVWLRNVAQQSIALDFLGFLRSPKFSALLSQIFEVALSDQNVADPNLNTNFFRMGPDDFVSQHADESPNRELCLLLYLNLEWQTQWGGELLFLGKQGKPIKVPPLFNRCVVFDPSSTGSEHWVAPMNEGSKSVYRYNVTSWYWSE